ncbi:hypothetical protein [Sphingomonas sp. 3-13AW]|uniref:hypothetical protein n=1 Tax=Sphingomonas sp. 3-13AW TaxID=3050450 RepID=UPI003BB5635A
MIDHLTRLARIVHALRAGQTITSGPFTDETSRRRTTTQEWFYTGEWRVTHDQELMHRTRVQIGSGAAAETAEPTDWSPQDIMQASVHWNVEDLAALPELPAPGTDPVIDRIMALADGDWHMMAGREVRMAPHLSDKDCPWTIEDRRHFGASRVQPLEGVFSDLVFAKA